MEDATFYVDVPYGTHPKHRFDVVLPPSIEPTPLLIYIHGGGFTGGNKRSWYDDQARLRTFYDAGIATATVNYRLLASDGTESEGLRKPLGDSLRAVRFLRRHAVDFNVDPERIGLVGGSAGGGTVLWIGLGDRGCSNDAPDPVDRTEVRVRAVAAVATQATYDVVRWETDVFARWQPELSLANVTAIEPDLMLQMGALYGVRLDSLDDLEAPAMVAYREEVDMLTLPDPSDPPLYLYNGGPPAVPIDWGTLVHHPMHAETMYEAAITAGMPRVELQTQERREGEAGTWIEMMVEVL